MYFLKLVEKYDGELNPTLLLISEIVYFFIKCNDIGAIFDNIYGN